ncbi:hypothetical protein GOODEAATRI_013210, partial [Goodea atripinnis]
DNLSVFLRGCEELGLKGSQLFDPGDLQDTSIRANLKKAMSAATALRNAAFETVATTAGTQRGANPCLHHDTLGTTPWTGRGSDSEADAPSRKPDVRKDDMLARRTASSESRCPVPFNQFLPNRTNASCYIPAPRRKQHTEEGEQRSTPIVEEKEERSPSPNIILRSENEFLSFHNSACNSSSDGEQEPEKQRVPDVHRDDLASRRVHRSPVNSRVHQFVPPPVCTNKDRERWEGIRRASQHTLQEKEIRSAVVSYFYSIFSDPLIKFFFSDFLRCCLMVDV